MNLFGEVPREMVEAIDEACAAFNVAKIRLSAARQARRDWRQQEWERLPELLDDSWSKYRIIRIEDDRITVTRSLGHPFVSVDRATGKDRHDRLAFDPDDIQRAIADYMDQRR